MRLPPALLAVTLVLVTTGCLGLGGESGSSGGDLDSEEYERLRSQVEALGTDAFAAAAEAVGTTGDLPGSGTAEATVCSGVPGAVVQVTMGSTLVYASPGPTDALDRVVVAWRGLGLTEVEEADGAVEAETTIEGVRVGLVLGNPVAARDGSDRELRYLSFDSRCFDLGPDAARDFR